jgi:hypothetical protein
MVTGALRRALLPASICLAILAVTAQKAAAGGIRSFKGTLNLKFQGSTSGPCQTQDGYSQFCQSGDCVCWVWTGTVPTPLGRADAELDLTEEHGYIVSSGVVPFCAPARFEMFLDNMQDDEDWSGPGGICGTITDKITINGGAVLTSTDLFTSGSATASGNVNANTGKLVLHVNGNFSK